MKQSDIDDAVFEALRKRTTEEKVKAGVIVFRECVHHGPIGEMTMDELIAQLDLRSKRDE